MSELTTENQTPVSYNAENGKGMDWKEAVSKGYIEGGNDESIKNSADTPNE